MRYNFKASKERIGSNYNHDLKEASYSRVVAFFIVRLRYKYMNTK